MHLFAFLNQVLLIVGPKKLPKFNLKNYFPDETQIPNSELSSKHKFIPTSKIPYLSIPIPIFNRFSNKKFRLIANAKQFNQALYPFWSQALSLPLPCLTQAFKFIANHFQFEWIFKTPLILFIVA